MKYINQTWYVCLVQLALEIKKPVEMHKTKQTRQWLDCIFKDRPKYVTASSAIKILSTHLSIVYVFICNLKLESIKKILDVNWFCVILSFSVKIQKYDSGKLNKKLDH